MNFVKAAKLRRVIPAGAVIAILALAYLAPLPADASKVNNCGVKGGYAYAGYAFAFHDHGKPCPNRPFPGHGKGALRQLGIHLTTSESGGSTTAATEAKVRSKVDVTTAETDVGPLTEDGDDATGGHGHGHGKSHGHGNGLIG